MFDTLLSYKLNSFIESDLQKIRDLAWYGVCIVHGI